MFPGLNRLVSACILVALVVVIAVYASGRAYESNILCEPIVVVASVYSILRFGIAGFVKRYKPAMIMFFAWLSFICSIVVFILTDFGVVPYGMITVNAPQIGGIVEAVMLSIGLAYKVSMLKKEWRLAEEQKREKVEKYRSLLSTQHAKLESAVRTRAIELEAANRMKDKLFSIVAHDLKSPLNSLVGFLKIFRDNVNKSFTREELVLITSELRDSVQSTVAMIENILEWARSQMESEKTNARVVNLAAVATEIIASHRLMASGKNIALAVDIPPSAHALIDEDHLRFILRNLITNAIKFTPAGGSIQVSAVHDDKSLELLVTDTGIGIAAAMLPGIFKIDVKKGRVGTANEKGAGLGLVLVKEFVEHHGGRIEVSSREGQGSTFKIILPSLNTTE